MAPSYEPQVHAVMDHVRNHLDQELSLETLAAVAGFSQFHFHRLFKRTTGETTAQFTRRARLERAVSLMRGAPERSLASIGAEVGFATPSEFSRVFKAAYGLAPSRWDRRSRVDAVPDITPTEQTDDRPSVVLRRRPAYRVTGVRIRDPWVGDNMEVGYRELRANLASLGVRWDRVTLVGLSWESGKLTPLDRLTYDLGVAMPTEQPLQKQRPEAALTGGRALVRYDLPPVTAAEVSARSLRQTAVGWEELYQRWLPGSGFEPADHPAIKFFRTVPTELCPQSWHVDCSIAVRRAFHRG